MRNAIGHRSALRRALALAALAACAGPAAAQAPVAACPAGRTFSGACANPATTAAAQQRAIVFTQSKISYLGPALPFGAGSYIDAARDRQSLTNGISKPVVTTPVATPPAGAFIGLPPNINPSSLNLAAPYAVVPGGIRIR